MKKIVILFWKLYARFYDLRPRLHMPKYSDFPIASTPIIPGMKKYDYPDGIKVLYEWEEKGHRWIAFTR
jgi:hypothetical protein